MEPEKTTTEEQIDQYVTGRLSEKEAERLWSTLLVEPEKLDYLKTSAAAHKLYEKTAAKVIYMYRLMAVAAALVAIAVVLNLLRFTEDDYVKKALDLQAIDDTGFAALRELRDESDSYTAEDSMFDAGLNLAFSGNMEKAKETFEKLTRTYPVSVSAAKTWLNIGIILYNQKQFTDAVDAFDKALSMDGGDSRFLREKMLWFKSNAQFQLKNYVGARSSAYEAFQLDGTYHDEALELIRFLDYKLGTVDYKPVNEN